MFLGEGVIFLSLLEVSKQRRQWSRLVGQSFVSGNHCCRVRIIASICVSVLGFHKGHPLEKGSLSTD